MHRLHGNRGGGHGSWAPARHPAPRRLQAPGLRPPRRRGPRGLHSEFPAPALLRPRLRPCDSAGSKPRMAHLGTSALGCASVPGLWHAGMRQETRAQLQVGNMCGQTPPRGSMHLRMPWKIDLSNVSTFHYIILNNFIGNVPGSCQAHGDLCKYSKI